MSETAIHRFVEEARYGRLARLVRRLPSGWAVLGDPQVRLGYCLLYPDPVVASLNDLAAPERARFLADMGLIGDAVLSVTGAVRINYEILGNAEPALHAHVVPRALDEPEALRARPIWFHDWEAAPPFDPVVHGETLRLIGQAIDRLLMG